ncbi:hypothetical protein GGX14DRAFT_400518 [Mycena pura]|uniref:Uncharacterized protein n=1 Tax=Mycena pura TaxID=153505 RepID=A0AAD6YBC0_9AGAR|nr:hypothetical protein GGX14DRAFT_400518 [Mycena pura]
MANPMANPMANIGPTPIKCHEANAMALAGGVTIAQNDRFGSRFESRYGGRFGGLFEEHLFKKFSRRAHRQVGYSLACRVSHQERRVSRTLGLLAPAGSAAGASFLELLTHSQSLDGSRATRRRFGRSGSGGELRLVRLREYIYGVYTKVVGPGLGESYLIGLSTSYSITFADAGICHGVFGSRVDDRLRIILFGTPRAKSTGGALGVLLRGTSDYVKFDKIAGAPGHGGYAASRI